MSLTPKLKLSTDKPLVLLNIPAADRSLFAGFDLKTSLPMTGELDQLVVFAANKKALGEACAKIIPRLSANAVFWVGYPKKSSGMNSDLLKTENWMFIFDMGYIIAGSAALNDTWSGIRIKKRDPSAKYVSVVPMEERKVPGIDYINRTAKLPKDAAGAMAEFPGLETFFNSMSFTHKREYVEAIEEAKKPETRRRRIDKMIEMLIELRDKKKKK